MPMGHSIRILMTDSDGNCDGGVHAQPTRCTREKGPDSMALLLLILLVLLIGGAGLLAFAAKVVVGGVLLAILAAVVLVALFTSSLRHA